MDDNPISVGCVECGYMFEIDEIFEGGCPCCSSTSIITFPEALGRLMELSHFLEEVGLEEEDT